ncbi:META domain-containing protein [Falsigemmobacter faecalis]|uniref:META domain-containing protein n=1 Tax=Falsigemmobacter faecalis TaxID=2488730 RepID=A0A3P3DU27_9RHOB|nr:META domain-containing protein [Falsigemmobacter faecalis]RRH76208.1 META domain-containing protein [Falsigemmobacter faecalis]
MKILSVSAALALPLLVLPALVQAQAQTHPVVMGRHEVIFRSPSDQPGVFYIDTTSGQSLEVEGVFPPDPVMRNPDGSNLLLKIATTTARCPVQFAWLQTGGPQIRMTESFGTCSMSYQPDPAGLAIEQPGMGQEVNQIRFALSGERVTVSDAGPLALGIDLSDPASLAGQSPRAVLTAAETRERFLAILPGDSLGWLAAAIEADAPEGMVVADGWLVGTGQHANPALEDRAAIAISLADGRVIAAHWAADGGQWFGRGADLVLADPRGPVGAGFPKPEDLSGVWQVTLMRNQPVTPGVTVDFRAGGSIGGEAQCNFYKGDYQLPAPGEITISSLGATRRACPELGAEQQLLMLLQSMTQVKFNDPGIWLGNDSGDSLELERAQ